jgi:hypothetical protein
MRAIQIPLPHVEVPKTFTIHAGNGQYERGDTFYVGKGKRYQILACNPLGNGKLAVTVERIPGHILAAR